jgi:hypothetical protein
MRDNDGKFLPGKSGNPSGKKVGLKAKITLRKQELENAVRGHIRAPDVRRVWDRIVQDALEGSAGAQKLVLEYSMSKVSDLLDKNEDKGPAEYVFYVVDSRPAPGEKQIPEASVVDGEFTHVPDEEPPNGSAK